jgi:mRNA-degrading endonuclease YafQ of YafQ-DinJ toxin-antitoxin module
MKDLNYTSTFVRKAKKIVKKNKTLSIILEEKLNILAADPEHPTLKTHKVNAIISKSQLYSSSITGDIRIIWDYSDGNINVIDLLDIGKHSGKSKVYK